MPMPLAHPETATEKPPAPTQSYKLPLPTELYGPFKMLLHNDPVTEQIAFATDDPLPEEWNLSYVKYVVSVMPRAEIAAICFHR